MTHSKNIYPKFYHYNRIVKAKLFIDNNYHNNINLEAIADEAYFSKFHFIRLFKSLYGKTPHQYLISVRVEKAKYLLRKGVAVSDACFNVGFNSLTSFTGLFKKYVNKPPALYQRFYRHRQEKISVQPLHFIPACFASQKGWTEKSNIEEAQ